MCLFECNLTEICEPQLLQMKSAAFAAVAAAVAQQPHQRKTNHIKKASRVFPKCRRECGHTDVCHEPIGGISQLKLS